ncbi:MAG: hypothetical protein F4Y61_03490 [Rhodothermaceae bacterium]|nr:hypothetical protein [Rhodothermaceae bacterium]
MLLVTNRRWTVFLFAGLIVLAGCRTYGDSEDEIAESLSVTVQQIAAEASAMETEADRLAEAAATDPELSAFSDRMRVIASEYMAVAQRQQELINEVLAIEDNVLTNWVGRGRYGVLHRAFGALISERELAQAKRQSLSKDLGIYLGHTRRARVPEEGRFQIRPHHYNRPHNAIDLKDLLADIESVSVP